MVVVAQKDLAKRHIAKLIQRKKETMEMGYRPVEVDVLADLEFDKAFNRFLDNAADDCVIRYKNNVEKFEGLGFDIMVFEGYWVVSVPNHVEDYSYEPVQKNQKSVWLRGESA